MRIGEYRATRPVEIRGRVLSSGERVRLREQDALPLVASGHLVEVEAALLRPPAGRWCEPVTR